MDAKTLKALGDPKRFLLLQLMSERGYCVSALAVRSELSESAVSQHLKVLREAGLVFGVKRGYYTHYCVDREVLGRVIDALEAMRSATRKPCGGPFYGCPVAEQVGCKADAPQNKGRKEEKETC